MRIAYVGEDGLKKFYELSGEPLVIGCSPDADITLNDSRVSRLHCGIRMEGNKAIIKDLGSKTGTFVNAERVTFPLQLMAGDHIRIGSVILAVEEKLAKGTDTILHEIEEEMDNGKEYRTILHEIVEPDNEDKNQE
jgi:pSer/pThr/pTyr-binding forkhead associated (FHA) protein